MSQKPLTYAAMVTASSRYARSPVRSYAASHVRPHQALSSMERLMKCPSIGSEERAPAGNATRLTSKVRRTDQRYVVSPVRPV